MTTNFERANLAGTAIIDSIDGAPAVPSVALAFQMRAVPTAALTERVRPLTETETLDLERATDEALGRVEPE